MRTYDSLDATGRMADRSMCAALPRHLGSSFGVEANRGPKQPEAPLEPSLD